MNSKERFLAALAGQIPDRTPVAHVAALTTVELQQATGCPMPDVHLDAERLARLCYANHEVLGFDAVTFNINYFGEPAALGSEMDWGDQATYPSYGPPIWVEPEEAIIPEDLLDREPIATYLDATRIARRDYGDRVGVIAKVMGPLSMVQAMHGVDKTMMDMVLAPDTVHHFLGTAVEILVRCANAELEQGADAVAIGEGGAGGNMLSPQMHERFLLDVHRRMIAAIQGPTIMHICGDITPRLGTLLQVGLCCFNFDWAITPQVMVDQVGGAFCLMGNVNTADLLLGQPDEIERQVIENLEAGVDIISPGCAISPRCPNANFQAMVKAAIQWHADRNPQGE
jgi:[methyl-Co(III) methanol-specific corrinoid protein]:coenzyme M methyltransferase